MGFLNSTKKNSHSAVLIDVGVHSVGGAYANYVPGELPTVLYARRLPVERKSNEPAEEAMLRALLILVNSLVTEGAPALARATGSGTADTILVSIDSPWQDTTVRVEHIERDAPFLFTKALVTKAMEKNEVKTDKKLIVDESVIGTILNGYVARNPYGKNAHRATVIILSSKIDETVVKNTDAMLRSAYHTRNILSIGGGSLRFQTMLRAFPHENDALIIDAVGPITSIAIVRNRILAVIVDVPDGSENPWTEDVERELSELAKNYPLPRTILLLGGEPETAEMKRELSATVLEKLWLSNNPPKIVTVLPSHLNGLVRQSAAPAPDLSLLLMALYLSYRSDERK
ncbi:MAG: hypothetical protein WAN50_02285 [Minisyncoccia bacterium]